MADSSINSPLMHSDIEILTSHNKGTSQFIHNTSPPFRKNQNLQTEPTGGIHVSYSWMKFWVECQLHNVLDVKTSKHPRKNSKGSKLTLLNYASKPGLVSQIAPPNFEVVIYRYHPPPGTIQNHRFFPLLTPGDKPSIYGW